MNKVSDSSAWLVAGVLAAGCSAVLPLGPGYTFGDRDGGVDAAARDAGRDADVPPPDATTCEPVTMEVACAGRCGEVTVCDDEFDCGGCVGELSCGGGGNANECGCASPPCATWSGAWGDVAQQEIAGIAADRDGNVFVLGSYRGTLTVGGTTHTNPGMRWRDVFLVKLDPTGAVLWSRSWGGSADGPTDDDDQRAVDIAVDGAGNVVLAIDSSGGVMNFGGGDITTDSDIVLVKLRGDGEHVFSAAYGTAYIAYPTSIAIDPASYDIFVVGDFWGTLRFGSLLSMTAAGDQAYYDMFIVRLSPDGTPMSSQRFGDGSEQLSSAVAVSGDFVHVAAVFNGTFTFGSGAPPLSTTSWYSLAIARLGTGSFHHVWSRQFGTDVWRPLLAADLGGNLFVAGQFAGSLDIQSPPLTSASTSYEAFLAKLGPDGTTAWARQYPNVELTAIEAGADGSVYLAGTVKGDADLGAGPQAYSGTPDAFVARLDAAGNHVWSRIFAAPIGSQTAVGVAPTDGATWLGVVFEGQLDLGAGHHTTLGGNDVAAARFVE